MRYVVIGTGSRAAMYYNALGNNEGINKSNELVALMDLNQKRMNYEKIDFTEECFML